VLSSAICSGSDVLTCEAQGSCTAYVQTGTCGGGQTCVNGACVDQGCGSGCTTPPGAACQDQNTLVTYGADGGVCSNNSCVYPSTQTACPNGCLGGACEPTPNCSPGATRCNGSEVEQCNADGTAWLEVSACPTTCTGGLCDAPCAPGSTRCDNGNVDMCSDAGTAWNLDSSTCANGCASGSCVQDSLTVDGQTITLDGVNTYANGVVVKNGGSIQVGSTGTLTIVAASVDVEISSSIVGTPGTQPCSAPPDNVANGIRLIAPSVTVDGTVTWTPGACTLDGIVIRADSISGSGTVSAGADRDLLLYGTTGLAPSLSHPGATTSLMPPAEITSATYPAGAAYNDDGPPPSFSWDQPYRTVAAYIYSWGQQSAVPPPTGSQDLAESLALGAPPPVGLNYLDVVTFDQSGDYGTVPHEFTIQVDDVPPALSSTTNPNQGSYTTNTDAVIAWSGGNPGQGYYYLFDNFPDTRPTNLTGTYEATTQSPPQQLLSNISPGRWFFHMIAYDSMGYPTHGASHYEIDVGTAPSAATSGTIAGTVQDPSGTGIAGAQVVVQRGLYSVTTGAGGVYTFGNSAIPDGTYEVVAEAPGTQWQSQTLTVTAGATTDGDFTLTSGDGCPSCADPCSGVSCADAQTTCSASTLYVPPLWSATCELGTCSQETAAAADSCPYGCDGSSQCWATCVASGSPGCSPGGQPCCPGSTCDYYSCCGYYCE
jgi:hypothetical protein